MSQTIQEKIEAASHFQPSERLVEVLSRKTRNPHKLFFRNIVGFYFGVVAASMRTSVQTADKGTIPVNIYAINLLTSGGGKGYSTNIMQKNVLEGFRKQFLSKVLPKQAAVELERLAVERSAESGKAFTAIESAIQREYADLGEYEWIFDDATVPAVKQTRQKILMSKAGSLNLVTDEIGNNISKLQELLVMYLELFDKGEVNPKLTKSTRESGRTKTLTGSSPANMLLFGTPSKLLDGGKVEGLFSDLLETGFARRSITCYISPENAAQERITDVNVLYDMMTDQSSEAALVSAKKMLTDLATLPLLNQVIQLDKPVTLLLLSYQLWCEARADKYPVQATILRAEMTHRYFKALKLAGAYAFVQQAPMVTETILLAALKLIEECGDSFEQLMKRDKAYVRLAKFIADHGTELTQAELVESLPYYNGTEANKRELMTLAISYGFRNHLLIRRHVRDGVDLFSGSKLEQTDMNNLTISVSMDIASDYENIPNFTWDDLDTLTQTNGLHWINHHLSGKAGFHGGYRDEEHCIPGFNLVVLDVDKDTRMETAQLLLSDYTYYMYTTKSHTAQDHRFRIIMPLSHTVLLDAADFVEFMNNIEDWLPFETDRQTFQRSRKWLSHSGSSFTNEGKLLDPLYFVPNTKYCEERKKAIVDLANLSNIEAWFLLHAENGKRNGALLRYGLMLVDSGLSLSLIEDKVIDLNSRLTDPLEEDEIKATVFVTLAKRVSSATPQP